MLLWEQQLYTGKKKKIEPATITLKQVKRTDLGRMWNDVISQQSIYTSISQYGEQYNDCWQTITTHDLEAIGEAYAYSVLKLNLSVFPAIANLNPSGFGALDKLMVVVRTLQSLYPARQVYDKYNSKDKDQKPYDMALFTHREIDRPDRERSCSVIFNHKLLSTKKRSAEKRFGEGLDDSPALKVIWKTSTRPFYETFTILSEEKEQAVLQQTYDDFVNGLLVEEKQILELLALLPDHHQPLTEKISKWFEFLRGGLGSLSFSEMGFEQLLFLILAITEEEVK